MSSQMKKSQWRRATRLGAQVLWALEIGGLVIIAIATLIAGALEVMHMVDKQSIDLADLLLLFLYLEVLAMVGIYLESGALPVRLPLYIGIVALARYIIIDAKHMDDLRILAISAGILILTIAVLVTNYTHHRYPRNDDHRVDENEAADDPKVK